MATMKSGAKVEVELDCGVPNSSEVAWSWTSGSVLHYKGKGSVVKWIDDEDDYIYEKLDLSTYRWKYL